MNTCFWSFWSATLLAAQVHRQSSALYVDDGKAQRDAGTWSSDKLTQTYNDIHGSTSRPNVADLSSDDIHGIKRWIGEKETWKRDDQDNSSHRSYGIVGVRQGGDIPCKINWVKITPTDKRTDFLWHICYLSWCLFTLAIPSLDNPSLNVKVLCSLIAKYPLIL